MTATLAVLCTIAAIGLGGPLRMQVAEERQPEEAEDENAERPLLLRLRPALCGLAVLAGWSVFGGWVGVAVGLVGAAFSWRALSKLESPTTLRRRHELERDLPIAVHLLGACLAAGTSVDRALETVAAAMPGSMGEELALVLNRLRWGSDPASVWRAMHGPLEPLGKSMARAHETGTPVRPAVVRLAADLRAQAAGRAAARARTVEVRAAAPLGVCFLPAFVLLGVVPMAVGLFSSLGVFG